jgi:signal transduction histidine kinase
MSDVPNVGQITNPDRLARDGPDRPSPDFQRWLAAKQLTETWLPSFYHPRFEVEWIEWCDGTESAWRVFNSFLHKDDLPAGILARLVASTQLNEARHELKLSALPNFNLWRQVYRSIWDLQGGLNPSDWSQMLEIWQPIFKGQVASSTIHTLAADIDKPNATVETPESSIIAVIRDISRPVLGLKAVHEGKVVRIFLIIGPDQADDPLHAAALLEGYASILSENLNRATHFTAEAAQKESIRRLSWLRHHLNGPIGIASNALDDIRLYLSDNPQVGDALVPNPDLANRMAARPGRNLSDHTLRARLNVIEREISNLKVLSDRIRQLSEIRPDEPMCPIDLAGLLRSRADRCRELVPNLALHYYTCDQPVVILGSERLLIGAIDELLFNACRELKEHLVSDPRITVSVALEQHNAVIRVQDNGLPINDALPNDPFREGVTKYRERCAGTGLGLTIVRDIIGIHGGECLLAENRDLDQRRLAGATFSIVLPLSRGFETC